MIADVGGRKQSNANTQLSSHHVERVEMIANAKHTDSGCMTHVGESDFDENVAVRCPFKTIQTPYNAQMQSGGVTHSEF